MVTNMKRSPLQIVDLMGTPFEIAFKMGRLRARKIRRRIEIWDGMLHQTFHGAKGTLDRLIRAFYQSARTASAHYLEEIAAMAEGAGVSFEALFRLNLTELRDYADKCTTLVLPFSGAHGRRILLGHNEDWNPKRNDVFILRAKLPELSYVIVAYDGYLPGLSCGLNSHGLYHAINYLKPSDRRVGLPRIFITRRLVTASGFDEVLSWVKGNHRAFGQAIHMAKGSRYLGLELTAKAYVLYKPNLPTVHTNHYLSTRLKRESTGADPQTVTRYETASRMLRAQLCYPRGLPPRRLVTSVARRILSNRTGPHPIWREGDKRGETAATLVAAFLSTDRPVMEVYRKNPLSSRPRTVTFY